MFYEHFSWFKDVDIALQPREFMRNPTNKAHQKGQEGM